jgi:anti-anti-sigma regulatory factor
MPMIACDWELDVERGPNWLLVKVGDTLGKPREMPPLDDTLRSLLEEHFTYRLVLELDEIHVFSSELIGQLMALDKWIRARQGVMRLCGLSPHNVKVLRRCWLDSFCPVYRDRLEAVLGCRRPSQPR